MMKKLLLLAVLLPVVVESEMKAAAAPSLFTRAAQIARTATVTTSDWAWKAAHPWDRNAEVVTGNLGLLNFFLCFATTFYKYGLAEKYKFGAGSSRDSFVSSELPWFLALHELFTAGTTINVPGKHKNGLHYATSLAKIFTILADKLPSRDMQNNFCRSTGIPVWSK